MKWSLLIVPLFLIGTKSPAQKDSILCPNTDTVDVINVDEHAEFPGGFFALAKFVMDNINGSAPGVCEAHGCRTFRVKFMISYTGEVKDVSVVMNFDDCPAYEAELIRVFKLSPKWKPARVKGKAVNTYFMLPIKPRFP